MKIEILPELWTQKQRDESRYGLEEDCNQHVCDQVEGLFETASITVTALEGALRAAVNRLRNQGDVSMYTHEANMIIVTQAELILNALNGKR